MSHYGNSPGPGGMKRPLADPRQRLQAGRFGPGGPGRGLHQQFPQRHQQQMPMGGNQGRGRPGPGQQSPYGPAGRGGRHHQSPMGGPGRGFPPMHQQPGPPHMGQQQQQQFQPGPGRGFQMNRNQAPPPPPPQRPAFRSPPAMNNNHNRMHNSPPAPQNMGMGYGQMGGRGPPGPPPRQPFQGQHQQHQHPQHQYPPPQMNHSSPPPRPHQPLQQQQNSMTPNFHPQQQAQQQQAQHQHSHYQPANNQYSPRGPSVAQNHVAQPQRPPSYAPLAAKPQVQQQRSPATVASPKNVSAHYTQAQIDQAWSEHMNKGVKYYHNSITKTSTYEKPQALLTAQERQQQQQQKAAQAKKAAEASTAQTASTWTEYTDASTGKKYYSNGTTTTWEKPAGFVSPSAIVAQSKAAEEATPQEASKKKRKVKDQRETPFRNSEEAVAAFKGLLLAKGVSPTQKWNEVVKMCSSDARWDDCEAVLTTGERKQAMAEYQTKRFNELKDQERQERARAKDAFSQLLSEALPKLPVFSVLKTRFSDIRDSISKDDRFYAVQTEGDRETLYLDFCEELRKHDERKKRNKKREAQDDFCLFLKEKEEAGTLKFSSTWNSFFSSLTQSDKDDSRFKVSPSMTDPDRQLYFADFVIELQAQEDDKRRRIRDARRRAEKAQRDAYRDALESLGSEGKLTPSSHWRDIERIMHGESAYEAVSEQDREAPREIFEEFIDEWDEIYRRDRQFLSQLVHPTSNREILVTRETKYETFVKALLEEANNSPQTYAEARRITKTEEPRSSARLYFNELVNKAKEKAAIPYRRRGYGSRRAMDDDSSEDEGEIVEDGEVEDKKESEEEADKAKETAAPPNTSADKANNENAPIKEEALVKNASNSEGSAKEEPATIGKEAAQNQIKKEDTEKGATNSKFPTNELQEQQQPAGETTTAAKTDLLNGTLQDQQKHVAAPVTTDAQSHADQATSKASQSASPAVEEENGLLQGPETSNAQPSAVPQSITNGAMVADEKASNVDKETSNLVQGNGGENTASIEASNVGQAASNLDVKLTAVVGGPTEGNAAQLALPNNGGALQRDQARITGDPTLQSALPSINEAMHGDEALQDLDTSEALAVIDTHTSNAEEATEEDALFLEAFLTDEAPDAIEALQGHADPTAVDLGTHMLPPPDVTTTVDPDHGWQ